MDLRHLKYFLAVAEELNIGRAALRLHMSQPPLTRQIKALEEELGVALFLRTPRGVELTQAGEMFREEAQSIRMLVEAAVDRVQRAGDGQIGRLDVAIFGSGIYDAIPKLLHAYRERLPGVNVVLHTMSKAEQIEALRQRRISVGFNRMMPSLPDIGCELVATEPLMVAVNARHPLAAVDAVPFGALAEHPLVVYPNLGRPSLIDRVLELCQRRGFEPRVAQEVGDTITAIALVASGFGVSLIPRSATAVSMPGVLYRPLADAPEAVVDLSCAYRASDRSPLLQAFLALVREHRVASEVLPTPPPR